MFANSTFFLDTGSIFQIAPAVRWWVAPKAVMQIVINIQKPITIKPMHE